MPQDVKEEFKNEYIQFCGKEEYLQNNTEQSKTNIYVRSVQTLNSLCTKSCITALHP